VMSFRIVIGDTMETDILGCLQMGYPTVLVLSGSTKPADLAKYAYQPKLVVESLGHVQPKELVVACMS
jgi:NagD protein